jgi:hypothetical protein
MSPIESATDTFRRLNDAKARGWRIAHIVGHGWFAENLHTGECCEDRALYAPTAEQIVTAVEAYQQDRRETTRLVLLGELCACCELYPEHCRKAGTRVYQLNPLPERFGRGK